jgi:hypothetical protein
MQNVVRIRNFIFMKYFRNIFEPISSCKFEYLFCKNFLEGYTVIILHFLVNIPINILMLK